MKQFRTLIAFVLVWRIFILKWIAVKRKLFLSKKINQDSDKIKNKIRTKLRWKLERLSGKIYQENKFCTCIGDSSFIRAESFKDLSIFSFKMHDWIFRFNEILNDFSFSAFYGVIFKENEEAAFSNFYFWSSLGFSVAYAYSDVLCTSTKLYILLVLLVISIISYIIVDLNFTCRDTKTVLGKVHCISETNENRNISEALPLQKGAELIKS